MGRAGDVEYLKLVYVNFAGQIQRHLEYIRRTTFWGTGVLLGTTGYLTTNVKQVPSLGKAVLLSAVLLFVAALVFSILRAVKDAQACARQLVKIDHYFGAFESGRYGGNSPLYPIEWRTWGTEAWPERHHTGPAILILGLATLVAGLAILRLP